MFDLETAIQTWRHQYKYSAAFKGRDLDELEQHIRDQVDYLVGEGESPEVAFRTSVAELGGFHETEAEFRSVAWGKTRDRREVSTEIRGGLAMAGSYFKVAFRNLKKNRTSSFINVLGLSLAISVTLVSFLFVSDSVVSDRFHEHADEIFLVHQITEQEGQEQWWGYAPQPLGPALDELSSDVIRSVRIHQKQGTVAVGDTKLNERVRFADPEFFEMFTFPLESGSDVALRTKNQVILSAESKIRYFGEKNAVGESLSIQFEGSEPLEVIVSGVAKAFPSNSDLRFSMLMSWDTLVDLGNQASDDWSMSAMATFVELDRAASQKKVEQELATFIPRINAVSEDWVVSRMALDNLQDLSRNRGRVEQSIANSIPWAPVIVLSAISLLLLMLSCFNYMNITIATSLKRLKEIGVRKVVGAQRRQLIFQFLAENVQISTLALLTGLWLAWQFILPAFNTISSAGLSFRFIEDWRLWAFMGSLVLGTGLVSGGYPAFYISSFRPTVIFQGRQQLGRRRPITQFLLVFQFLLTFLTVLSGIVFSMNGRFHAQQDWGYNADHIVVFRVESDAEYRSVLQAAESLSSVLVIAPTANVIGRLNSDQDIRFEGAKVDGVTFGVSRSYLEMMDLSLTSGYMLGDSLAQLGRESVLINEMFASELDLESPLGSFVEVDSVSYSIAGVLKDFHYRDFFESIEPAVFINSPTSEYQYVSLKVLPGSGSEVVTHISDAFEKMFPGTKLSHHFQDQELQDFVEESSGLTRIFMFVALISLFISCLSIYALSAQNVLNQMKEIGIRKVLGGRSSNIAQLVNRKLLWLLSIAAIVCIPLGYIMLDALLDDIYAYRMPLNAIPFILTYLIVIATAVLTIATQVRRIERARPSDILRSE